MGYLQFTVPTTGTINGIKFFVATTDQAQGQDHYTVVTPAGQLIEIDEDGSNAAALTTAGAAFSTTGIEAFQMTTASLTTGFPDTNNTALYSDYTKTTVIAGADVAIGEGAFAVNYNNSSDPIFRIHLHVPSILEDIDTLAQNVIDCQCECDVNEMKAQKYIKARAYLDLIVYKAENATSYADRTEIQTMITTLTNFLGGTDELCGSCC